MKRAECETQIKKIRAAIREYVEKHQDVPRNARGQFSLEPLRCGDQSSLESDTCLVEDDLRCTLGDDRNCDYVVSPIIEPFDLQWGGVPPSKSNIIVLSHSSKCLHANRDGKYSLMLLGDGAVIFTPALIEPAQHAAYSKWLDEFKKGAPGSNRLDGFNASVLGKE